MKNNCVEAYVRRALHFLLLCIWFTSGSISALERIDQDIEKVFISLELKNASVGVALDAVQNKTDFTFIYEEELIGNIDKPINISVKNKSIAFILKQISEQVGLDFRQINQTIAVKKNEKLPNKPDTVRPQQLHVSGTVTDKNGVLLPGVNITVKDAGRGTSSDFNGNYSIVVDNDNVLVFSYIGYKTMELAIEGRTVIDVRMQEDIITLGEVEVNAGYYKVKERERTGSIVKITAKEIENQPVTNPLLALQGRVAGLEITPVHGTPGVAPKIRIRGENSMRIRNGIVPGVETNGNLPMYIIDGIPVNSAPISNFGGSNAALEGGFDPLSTLNPENIESIEVLKDADATAIYGSRGANGVILITTKKGHSGETTLDINIYGGIGEVSSYVDLLNTGQYLEMRNEAFRNDGEEWILEDPFLGPILAPDLTVWDANRHTDWQKVLLGGTADILDIQGNISGGNETTSFRAGGGYHKETLIYPGNFGYTRATGHLNVNHSSADQKFRATISLNYGVDKHNLFSGGLTSHALNLPPNAPALFDEEGKLNWELLPSGGATWTNPLAQLETSDESENKNFVATAGLSYEVLPGLNLKTNLGYTQLNGEEIVKKPFTSISPDFRYSPDNSFGIKASASFGNNQRQSIQIEPQLSYSKQWEKHSLDILAGATYQENEDKLQKIDGSGYTSDALLNSIRGAEAINFLADQFSEYKYNAVFGRIGYTFKNRYYLNLTGRRDGSSRFGPENRFGNFGAIGTAWVFSEEPLVKEGLPFLNFGKLRASYGTTGNDNIGNYNYYDSYSINPSNYQQNVSLSPKALFNPDYKWEETKKLEAAINLGFAQNRIMLEAAWYRNRSSNQLIQFPLPATTGFNSVNTNFDDATVENSGWEVMLSGNIIRKNDLNWNASANLSVPKNKLVEFPGIDDSPYATIFKVGEPLSIQRLYIWEGVNPETGLHEFTDINEDGIISDQDKQFRDVGRREYYGGLNNTLGYKGLELSFLFQFAKQEGIKFTNDTPGQLANQPASVLNRWQQEGDMTNVQRFSQASSGDTVYKLFQQSDANWEDTSFIRLKTLSLSYSFPGELLKKIGGIKQAKLFLQGQNLFTVANISTLDPETGNGVPPLRMITSGLQLKF